MNKLLRIAHEKKIRSQSSSESGSVSINSYRPKLPHILQ